MRDNPAEQITSDVTNKQTGILPEAKTVVNFVGCGTTEFVDTVLGHTIGLVIASVDNQLYEVMNTDKKCHSIGILGVRTDASSQIFAADEAIKVTNSETISIELARNIEGDGGHGCLIIFDVSDISDARCAVEAALSEIECIMGDVYGSSAGHLELQYIARASYALNKAPGASIGKSFGMTCASPAAIGLMIADAAAKPVVIDLVDYASPS